MSAIPATIPQTEHELIVIDTTNLNASFFSLRGRRPKAFLVALAVVLVVELVARVLARGLPNPDWNFPQTDRKVGEMEEMAATGQTTDIVLVGNSSVNAAFLTDDLEAESGLGSFYNAGLDGSSMRLTEDWTLNVVLPLIAPETVVIGLTSRDLNDASSSSAEVFDKYMTSRGRARFLGEETAGQRVQRVLSRVSALVRISPFVRDPASLVTQYSPDGPNTGEFILPGEEYNPRPLDIIRTRERALNDYTLGGIELESLTRMVAELERRDIEVIIVEMPYVAEDYLDLHPNGVTDYDDYRAVVADFTATEGLAYIDLTDYPWSTAEFYDFLHVNSTGIAIVNTILAEALAALAG